MITYFVQYKFRQTAPGGGFVSTPGYYKNYKTLTVKAKDIDDLRRYLIRNVFKGRTGTSDVFRMDSAGIPDYGRLVGQLYRYSDEYIWFVRDTKTGWRVNPQTGRRA